MIFQPCRCLIVLANLIFAGMLSAQSTCPFPTAPATRPQGVERQEALVREGDRYRIPPTVWDMPELGKVQRSRAAIEHAVTILREPTSRLEERLLWFHGKLPPVEWPLAADSDYGMRHDQLVADLYRAYVSAGFKRRVVAGHHFPPECLKPRSRLPDLAQRV